MGKEEAVQAIRDMDDLLCLQSVSMSERARKEMHQKFTAVRHNVAVALAFLEGRKWSE